MSSYNTSNLNKVIRGSNRATYDIETVNTILDDGFIGYVSYVYDGTPISIPMAYGKIGDKIYLHGSLKNRMLLSILDNKKVSITVMHLDGLVLARSAFHHSVNYRSVTLFGDAVKVEDENVKRTALKCIVDQMIEGRWNTLRPMTDKEFNATLVIEVPIQTASAKVRAEGAIDEKSDLELPIWAGVVPMKQVALAPESDNLLNPNTHVPKHVLEYCEEHKD
ncbi:pyridoxamine 5'-phosphate oxidase family protein [Seonamhaeicola marinus]|uniref:Pyridoxamine 5'-phosphate oxidase family protein n=1 Tax=Seonamhaeicola marinus TaxID=1912246 RepID=A0A5D0HTL0_9FLAO|nr:pyridoxamine 5'-phosphate oxidase family protein [Seonamhaeicola marinus]TYA74694.1 pyridoxamine 5'-phosphate oxidase family protein [Seonamhaeicola marinus]